VGDEVEVAGPAGGVDPRAEPYVVVEDGEVGEDELVEGCLEVGEWDDPGQVGEAREVPPVVGA
jgi:hypothetical protein